MAQENQLKKDFIYPEIDPAVSKKIKNLELSEHSRLINYPYKGIFLSYGLDSVLLVHLMRKLKEVIEKKELSVEQYLKNCAVIYNDPKRFNITSVSIDALTEGGIYIPETRTDRRVSIFNCDHLNRISCSSPVQIGDPEFIAICRKHWSREDFSNPELIDRAIILAKDMWAANLIDYERFAAGAEGVCPPQDPAVSEAGKGLIDYYWQIVEADGANGLDRKRKWLFHQADYTENDVESGLIPKGIYIGKLTGFCQMLNRYEKPQVRIEEIVAETRRDAVAVINGKGVL